MMIFSQVVTFLVITLRYTTFGYAFIYNTCVITCLLWQCSQLFVSQYRVEIFWDWTYKSSSYMEYSKHQTTHYTDTDWTRGGSDGKKGWKNMCGLACLCYHKNPERILKKRYRLIQWINVKICRVSLQKMRCEYSAC